MNIREQIKRRVTFEQRRQIIRVWVGFRARFAPGRIRARNLPKLPNRRKWRTALSNALLWSCQGGTLTYQYRDIPMLKQPFEVALYMRLIWETKPGTIIEIGSHSNRASQSVDGCGDQANCKPWPNRRGQTLFVTVLSIQSHWRVSRESLIALGVR